MHQRCKKVKFQNTKRISVASTKGGPWGDVHDRCKKCYGEWYDQVHTVSLASPCTLLDESETVWCLGSSKMQKSFAQDISFASGSMCKEAYGLFCNAPPHHFIPLHRRWSETYRVAWGEVKRTYTYGVSAMGCKKMHTIDHLWLQLGSPCLHLVCTLGVKMHEQRRKQAYGLVCI